MGSILSSLIKDTAIYGLSSMFGRFLNWLLTFVYVKVRDDDESLCLDSDPNDHTDLRDGDHVLPLCQ